ncbi:MAG: amidohydrolase family protein [Chitinophagaceae bacterium]
MRKQTLVVTALLLFLSGITFSQPTFPDNGVAETKHGHVAFINATIIKDANNVITNATLIIKDGKIVSVGTGLKTPAGAVEVDCKGKYIYPSFIDIYTDYGTPQPQSSPRIGGAGGGGFFAPQQYESSVKGPFGWNQAIKSDIDVYRVFTVNETAAKSMRDAGFGTVLTHVKDGVARGTGAVVTLANEKENLVIVKEKASAHYSFNKGSSNQSYPSSMMGYIALLRQTYLDAQWYKTQPAAEGLNLSLKAWNENLSLPQIFESNDKWNNLRADRIGDEFGVQYIIKAGQNEYQRINEMKGTNATFILPLNYPLAQDAGDPNEARFISLNDMKHWELSPTNAAAFEKAGIPFCLTTADLRSVNQFWTNLRKAMDYGLSESKVIDALTKTPATTLGIYDKVGSLDAGKLGNFLITNGTLFNEKTIILQNWVQGIKYTVKDDAASAAGTYALTINTAAGLASYTLDVKPNGSTTMFSQTAQQQRADTVTSKLSFDGKQVKISFAPIPKRQRLISTPGYMQDSVKRPGIISVRGMPIELSLPANAFILSGISNGTEWNGTGIDSLGNSLSWTAVLEKAADVKPDTIKKKEIPEVGKVVFPFEPFGWIANEKPKQETILIKNATVWTNEKEGVLLNSDVLIKDGKIAAVGKGLDEVSARVIDGTGKHVTPGIIDEHSHIAAASINEGAQSVTSEVRIGDNINPDDINIYRQLSGGVTTSHILHGSANVIGGQTQLLKLRWGGNDDELKFKGWTGQIKFALGENVKRSASTQGNTRYPDTRMGVEQVLVDAFTRAKDYQKIWKEYELNKNKKGVVAVIPRRDLELEALVEVLEKKRFITCHSYVQSEINSAMKVAEEMGYTVNTFTHILEGYKVADKMLKHGSFASTFSDWWAYKMEVEDAIPYNAAIMQKVGLTVAINSDDAEMARRLNQEAAKIVKYGGVTEEEALKMVTLNPAKMLHIADKVGSLKVGKDGDVVLWSYNPLSIYAKSLYTIVDGTIFFDRQKDELLQKQVDAERLRLVRKMNSEKRSGAPTIPAQPGYQIMHSCSEHEHSHGLLVIDADNSNNN